MIAFFNEVSKGTHTNTSTHLMRYPVNKSSTVKFGNYCPLYPFLGVSLKKKKIEHSKALRSSKVNQPM